jgi:hypothetical protein
MAAATGLGGAARAADHADGTASVLSDPDPSVDINDVFAWSTPDAARVNLAMSVFPKAVAGSKFSDAVKYVFHLASKAQTILDAAQPVDVICQFDAAQKISCWVVRPGGAVLDYVSGDASSAAGLVSASGKTRVFAGLRNDPFFFNLAGFRNATRTVAQAVAAFTSGNRTYIQSLDAAGCPTLAPGIATALLSLLSHDCSGNALSTPPVTGGTAIDAFSKPGPNAMGQGGCTNQSLSGNVLLLVVQLDKSMVSVSGGPILGVWASTNR